MANALTALNPEVWKPVIQDYLNNMLIARDICNTKCEALLQAGDQVNFPKVSDVRVQSYTQGTNLTADALTATQSSLTVDQSKVAMFVLDPVQEKQSLANYGMELAYQSAFQLRNNIDQHVLNTAINGASSQIAGGTLAAATLYTLMTDVKAQLSRNNATDGQVFSVLDPERIALLEQSFVANGFNVADTTLKNGFVGSVNGFRVYTSNNLPYSVAYTQDTIPVAGTTITAYGVTWTWAANGAAAAPGEISIGANNAAAQANLLLALNGTGTPAAATYIDVSVDERRSYQNGQVAASAFVANVTTITAFGKIGASTTSVAGNNAVGTETGKLVFGRMGAPSLAIQMLPELYIREEPLQLAKNYMTHTLFGDAVFSRDAKRLVRVTMNA